MSYTRGWQAINLEMPDRIPHTEYLFHRAFIRQTTGCDPESSDPAERAAAGPRLAKTLDYDFLWTTFPLEWQGPRTEMGHGQYTETGEDVVPAVCPFSTPEQVLDFEPERDLVLPASDDLTRQVKEWHQRTQADYDDTVVPGGFYNSVFTWPILTFGWEPFLMAAELDKPRFDAILEGFTRLTERVVGAHIAAEIPLFLWHDDIAWATGLPFAPAWYRRHVFPRYRRLWNRLHDEGIRVLFCSDGDFTVLVDDLAEAGADGFIFEPLTDLEKIVTDYGDTKVIIGNIDTRILMTANREAIREEVRRCADLGRTCPGYFFAVGNHIPYNTPIEGIEYYLEAIDELGKR